MPVTKKSKQTAASAASVVQEDKTVATPYASPKAKVVVVTEEQQLINEAAQIHTRLIELEVPAMQKRLDDIKKIFQARGKDFPPNEEVVLMGTEGRVILSKARVELEITDPEAMIAALTQPLFNKIAKVTLTDLRRYLTDGDIFKFASQGYGSRSTKLIEKL